MRALLVHPRPGRRTGRVLRLPPLGLACIAGALRAAGHEVRILDATVARSWPADLDAILARWRPEVAGISACTAQMPAAAALAARIKGFDRRIAVVLGGVHPTLFPAEAVGDGAVDFAVRGEGERTVVDLLAAVAGSGPLDRVAGIAYRDRHGPAVTAPRPPAPDLDALPAPAYDLLPVRLYSVPYSGTSRAISMVTSRGCPYPCTFCDAAVVHGRRYRAHSAERVAAEMALLARELGIREVLFKDSEFVIDRGRVERLCDLLAAAEIRLSWSCSARVDRADAALLGRMAAAGCRLIQFGVESGDPGILDRLKKRISVDRIREAFAAARAHGIRTTANFLVGVPGETEGSIEATDRLIREIRPDFIAVEVLEPYPGTEIAGSLRAGAARAIDPEVARRRRARLLRSFYLRPGRILERIFTASPRRWSQNLSALRDLVTG